MEAASSPAVLWDAALEDCAAWSGWWEGGHCVHKLSCRLLVKEAAGRASVDGARLPSTFLAGRRILGTE